MTYSSEDIWFTSTSSLKTKTQHESEERQLKDSRDTLQLRLSDCNFLTGQLRTTRSTVDEVQKEKTKYRGQTTAPQLRLGNEVRKETNSWRKQKKQKMILNLCIILVQKELRELSAKQE